MSPRAAKRLPPSTRPWSCRYQGVLRHRCRKSHAPLMSGKEALMNTATTIAQVSLNRRSPIYWRVTLDNLPLDFTNPDFVLRMRGLVAALDELSGIPRGPGGPEAWPALLVRVTRTPAVSLTLIRRSGGAPEPQLPRLEGAERAHEGLSSAPRIARSTSRPRPRPSASRPRQSEPCRAAERETIGATRSPQIRRR